MRVSLPRVAALTLGLALVGCNGGEDNGAASTDPDAVAVTDLPVFSLAWSEYPSWSVFGVADDRGLIDGDEGKYGPVEREHGVDIVLREADYDTCLTMYGSGSTDAVCITNMDVLNPALTRDSIAIMPTSRSHGADALIVVGIDDVDELAEHSVRGLEKSVSEYCFVRNLQKLGKNPSAYDFKNMDPGAAAAAMQSGQSSVTAIMVWNPYVMQTLETRKDAKVLFDSTTIPGEIIDMVVMSKEAYEREHGEDFAKAVAAAFYGICGQLADVATRNATLVALGAKFSDLDARSMARVCEQTVFYTTPMDAQTLFNGDDLKATMERVLEFCVDHDVVESRPVVRYAPGGEADLVFDSSHLQDL